MEHPEKKTSIPHILDSTTILSSRLGKKNSQKVLMLLVVVVVAYKNLARKKSNMVFRTDPLIVLISIIVS